MSNSISIRAATNTPSPQRLNNIELPPLESENLEERITARLGRQHHKDGQVASSTKRWGAPNRSPLLSPRKKGQGSPKFLHQDNIRPSLSFWHAPLGDNEANTTQPSSRQLKECRDGTGPVLDCPNTYTIQSLAPTNHLFPRPNANRSATRPTLPRLSGSLKICAIENASNEENKGGDDDKNLPLGPPHKKTRLSLSPCLSSSPSIDSAFGLQEDPQHNPKSFQFSQQSLECVYNITGRKDESEKLFKRIRHSRGTSTTPMDLIWKKSTEHLQDLIIAEKKMKEATGESTVVNKGLSEELLNGLFQARIKESSFIAAEELLGVLTELEDAADSIQKELIRRDLKEKNLRSELMAEKVELTSKLRSIPPDIPRLNQGSSGTEIDEDQFSFLTSELSRLESVLDSLISDTPKSCDISARNELKTLDAKLKSILRNLGILSCITASGECTITLPFLAIRIGIHTGEQQFEYYGDCERFKDTKLQMSTTNTLKTNINLWSKAMRRYLLQEED